MIQALDFYYFSPTGGTKKVGDYLVNAMAEQVTVHDLMNKEDFTATPENDVVVMAVPVMGGRVAAYAVENLKKLNGAGKKAVTVVVYGVRAYEDALVELNDIATGCGFEVVASGAFVARHSAVVEVGAGRPDAKDAEELKVFGQKIVEKLESGSNAEVSVPGNRPYKPDYAAVMTPISTEICNLCQSCVRVCPTGAITVEDGKIVTDLAKCDLCLACVYACPAGGRILPEALMNKMHTVLDPLVDVRRENEMYV